MKIIKILLLCSIILIFFIYINKIEGIDIIDPSQFTLPVPRVGFADNSYIDPFRDIVANQLSDKKILIKINNSNLSFLSKSENSSLINKEIIATIIGNGEYACVKYDSDNNEVLYMCTYKITNIDRKSNNIDDELLSKLRGFFFNSYLNREYDPITGEHLTEFGERRPEIIEENITKIPSKSFNDLSAGFAIDPTQLYGRYDGNISQVRYNYNRTLEEKNKLNIVRENDKNDFIELEIINYLDTDTNEEIKITKEKIKKYIYSQFLQ